MKQAFRTFRFKPETIDLIEQCDAILEESVEESGGYLTLRQLYYQSVSRDIIANNQREYSKLSDVMNNARLAGLIDWEHIGDRTRAVRALTHWSTPASVIDSAYYSFRMDKWVGQRVVPEIWIEKDALVGVFERVCQEFDVPLFSCRGYTSISEMFAAAQRIRNRSRSNSQSTEILHFGDHDPSGIDMTRDVQERLSLLSRTGVVVRRLALNFDQIEQYNPPPNPTKVTDPRADAYRAIHGDSSWELDALRPAVLSELVRRYVSEYRDDAIYQQVIDEENGHKNTLRSISRNYDRVAEFVQNTLAEPVQVPANGEMPDCPICDDNDAVVPEADGFRCNFCDWGFSPDSEEEDEDDE